MFFADIFKKDQRDGGESRQKNSYWIKRVVNIFTPGEKEHSKK